MISNVLFERCVRVWRWSIVLSVVFECDVWALYSSVTFEHYFERFVRVWRLSVLFEYDVWALCSSVTFERCVGVWYWSVTLERNENKITRFFRLKYQNIFGLMISIMVICSRRIELVVFADEYSNVGSRESFRFRKAVKKSIYNYVPWWSPYDTYLLSLVPFII